MFRLSGVTSKYRSKLIANTYKDWIKPKSKVLDLGCGNGVVSMCLYKELQINLTGCDISNYLVEDIPFVRLKSQNKLPFKDKSFDVVMLNDMLHHTTFLNQERLINEALRVAKAVVIFEIKPTILGNIFDFLLNKIHNPKMAIPLTFRRIDNWHNLFSKMKVKYKDKKVIKPIFYPFNHIGFYLTHL